MTLYLGIYRASILIDLPRTNFEPRPFLDLKGLLIDNVFIVTHFHLCKLPFTPNVIYLWQNASLIILLVDMYYLLYYLILMQMGNCIPRYGCILELASQKGSSSSKFAPALIDIMGS